MGLNGREGGMGDSGVEEGGGGAARHLEVMRGRAGRVELKGRKRWGMNPEARCLFRLNEWCRG